MISGGYPDIPSVSALGVGDIIYFRAGIDYSEDYDSSITIQSLPVRKWWHLWFAPSWMIEVFRELGPRRYSCGTRRVYQSELEYTLSLGVFSHWQPK